MSSRLQKVALWASVFLMGGLCADAEGSVSIQQAGEQASEQAGDPAPEPAELAPRHREWLEENVVHIITSIEREAFGLLTSDEIRDNFIEAFWRSRDPTPGTVKNEAREEHDERLAYANRYLGRETPRPGWRTDRGRVYIQLGAPSDTLSYHDPAPFYPIELWFYRSNPTTSGLPPYFYVMFFRPNQVLEYKMYDPVTDGPEALVQEFMLQMADPRQIVDRLLSGVGHEVALASVNLIPTEYTDLRNPRPSIRNTFLFAAIEEAPLKGIDVAYAHRFVANRGEVEASVIYDTLPMELSAVAFWDERGMPYLHYGAQVPQEHVLLGQFESDYYLSLALAVDVSDPRGQTIVFGGDDIEMHFDKDRAQQVIRAPLAYYDRMGLVPGVYDLSVSLRNRVTDDTSLANVRVSVPFAGGDQIALSDLLVASAAYPIPSIESRQEPRAFRFGGEQLIPSPRGRLAAGTTAELFLQMVAPPGLEPGTTVQVTASLLDDQGTEVTTLQGIPTSMLDSPAPTPVRFSMPLETVPQGSYDLVVLLTLSSGQRLMRERSLEIVAPRDATRPEVLLAREARASGIEEYQLRGWQHMRKGEFSAAGAYYRAGLAEDPENIPFRRGLAGIEVSLGNYAEAVEVLRPLVLRPGAMRSDMLLLSEALRKAGWAADAEIAARWVLENGHPTAGAHNALADALVDLGRTAEAIEAYEASLAVDPGQPEVREKLARIKGGPGGRSR